MQNTVTNEDKKMIILEFLKKYETLSGAEVNWDGFHEIYKEIEGLKDE